MDIEALKKFVLSYSSDLFYYEGTEFPPPLPKFELYPRDYLLFAEQELDNYQVATEEATRERHLINCVSNLKRAIDCELDIFLEAFSLLSTFRKRNLSFEQKLNFLHEAGVFSSRTMLRLNQIRNKMEHEFEVPKLQDIEVYFDLTSAFVSVLERTIPYAQNTEATFVATGDIDKIDIGISFKYHREIPSITAEWSEEKDKTQKVNYGIKNSKEFAFLLKILLLLLQHERFLSSKYVIRSFTE